jgi:hypothetical protein
MTRKGLQQQQRGILRLSCKWTKPVQSAPNRNRRQDANCRRRLSAAKPVRGPDQKWNAKVFQRIILQRGVKAAAEYNPGGEK